MSRSSYLCSLEGLASEAPALPPAPWRHPAAGDLEMLAALMLDAYRGSIDDDGETIEDARREVESYFSGGSGVPLLDCSWLVIENDRSLSACLASLWQGVPLIAYILTAADSKRRGLARRGLHACLLSLKQAGYSQVRAVITDGNVPSENLFTQSGFKRETV